MSTFRDIIKNYVNVIQTKMNTDEFKILKETNRPEYERRLSEFVPEFKKEYEHLFKMIISGVDLKILDMFLDNMRDVENGNKTLNEARNNLGQYLHDVYVKDKLSK